MSMKAFLLLFILFTYVGCAPKVERSVGIKNPEDLRAQGDDNELKKALKTAMTSSEVIVPATQCPSVIRGMLGPDLSYECGAIRVPQDHDRDKNKWMSLGYFKYPQTFDFSKPLLVIEQGGPGSSSMLLAAYYMALVSDLNENFNIIAIEQRGTEWTYPVATCNTVHRILNQAKSRGWTEEQTEKKILEANRKCLKNVSKTMDLSKISSYQIAKDIVLAAKNMGFDIFDYFGVSYGTAVGQYLLNFSPDHINNMVLDSPAAIGRSWLEEAIKYQDTLIKKKFDDFVETKLFLWSSKYAYHALVENIKKLADTPVVITLEKEQLMITQDIFVDIFTSSLVLEDTYDKAFRLFSGIVGIDRNPEDFKLALENIVQDMIDENEFESNGASTEIMYQSIICREFSVDKSKLQDSVESWSFLASLFSEEKKEEIKKTDFDCNLNLLKTNDDIILTQPISTNKPILVIGGSDDYITAPMNVEAVAVNMPNASKDVFEGLGHGVFGGIECIDKSIVDYLLSSDGKYVNICENQKKNE